ncbi:MAG: tandem-95 repeat protein [Rhodopirellula sp.]|nr:tandem-95 repeat protein [Rhodopirellula sp.]
MASLVQRLRQARQGRKSSQRASKRGQASRSTARGTRKFRMESLESRQLLSVAPSLPGAWELCSEEMTTSCYVGDLGNSSDATDIVIGGAQVDSGDSGLGTNSAPLAQDDAYSIRSNQQIGANVLANDSDTDGDPLTVRLVAGAEHGQLQLADDGRFTYVPQVDFEGEDTFVYQASDGQADSAPATVRIAVAHVVVANAAPTATDDSYTVAEDGVLSIDAGGVLANDGDSDGDSLAAALIAPPKYGTLILGTDGSLQYTPNDDYHGVDTFTYAADDGTSLSQEATVTIEVTAVNDSPVAGDDSYDMNEGEVLSVGDGGVLANDTDIDGDTLVATVVNGPSHGSLELNPDGSFEYTPEAGFYGDDSFTYVAGDGEVESNLATVTVSIAAVNDAPTSADDIYSVIAGETLSVAEGGVLANDSDADGDSLSAAVVAEPANGVLVLNADGSFQYTPADGFVGDDSFTYLASDGQAESNLATVTVSVIRPNSAPVAADDAYSVIAGETVSVAEGGVLANDSDADGDSLSAVVVAEPANGVLVLNADGSFQYTPAEGFVGDDSFTYLASDGQAESNLATVTVSVIRPNSAPVAADDAYSAVAGETVSVAEGGVLANDSDGDGDSLSAVVVAEPANGVLVLNADGSFQYTPAEGFVGDDSFTYLASDGQAESNLATVTVSVIRPNSAPVAADDAYSVAPGETLAVAEGGVLANDSDGDGDSLAAVVLTEPAHGTLVLNADGSFQYTPAEGFVGDDSFTYLASDGQAESEPAEVVIAVRQTTMRIHLEVSGSAFGSQAGPIWGGSTFWVNAYVEDLRDLPQGVVGGAVDVLFDTLALTPTGNVAYGEAFSQFQQGTADDAAGVIDEAGALTTTGGIGVDASAPFVAWQFRRDGEGAPDDANHHVTFSIAPAGGDSTIMPSNFALVGQEDGADWSSVELGAAQIDLYLGDFTADGAVNHYDLAMWIPQMTAGSEASLNPLFDLDGDAAVDAADLDLLLSRMYEPVMPESPQTVASTDDIFAEDFDWADTRVSSGAQLASAPLKLKAIDSAMEGEDLWRWG